MYSISACQTPREKTQFERLPERLHGTDPAFIPPFPGSIVKYLSPKSPFNRLHGQIFPFLAYRDGKPVGRIAAIVNRAHNDLYADKTGFFGFFECINDPVLARALFDHAAQVLRAHGLQSIRGPYNPSINDECGVLTQGFEDPPCIGLVWNPPFYRELIEGLGFQPFFRSYGYLLPLHRLEMPDRLKPIVERAARRANAAIRPIKMETLEKELEIVHEIYNNTLKRNTGSVPISLDDLLGAADDMRAFADPDMILIAEMKGQNAGVALSLPDFNQILARAKKTPHWLRLLHIVWLMKTQRMTGLRLLILGISPQFRDSGGLHAWLLYEQFARAKVRYPNAVLGWIEDTNHEIRANSEMMGATIRQEWRIYEKALS